MKSEICLCVEVLKIKRNWDATNFARREWKERLRNLIHGTDETEVKLNPCPVDWPRPYEMDFLGWTLEQFNLEYPNNGRQDLIT